MVRCRRAGICTPAVYLVDKATHAIYMEYVQGQALKFLVDSLGTYNYITLQYDVLQTGIW